MTLPTKSKLSRAQKAQAFNQFIIDSLVIEIDRVRKDPKVINRVKQLAERDREILDELAK